jgi:hypothetical protein
MTDNEKQLPVQIDKLKIEILKLSTLIQRSYEILNGQERFNGQENIWRDIPGGRTLEFGAVQYDLSNHLLRYCITHSCVEGKR